ncbi:Cytochrome c, mono- and diheme variants [Spirosomataceae bacterium TFI 002]|nr:Cytochrome c, mono- and diheme variants [Spirosomataceae bacterium TFI 002]
MKSKLLIVLSVFLTTSCMNSEEMTYEKYLVNGEMLYFQKCSNCHGEDGNGLQNLYPPLRDADYFDNLDKVICIIKNGASGEMVVNGKSYNQAMPANPKLYDLDIAQLTTWMYAEFHGQKKFVSADSVKDKLLRCAN